MKSYYALTTPLRYYGRLPEAFSVDGDIVRVTLGWKEADVTRWKEPPHVWLANIATVDARAVEAFCKKYGVLWEDTGPMSEVRAAMGLHSRTFDEDPTRFAAFQDVLRKAWKSDSGALTELANRVSGGLTVGDSTLLLIAAEVATPIELVAKNLASFICALFLRDYAEGTARVCANPDCPHPFFLQERKGQAYCSHPCAVLINVRRFREREAQNKRKKSKRTKRIER